VREDALPEIELRELEGEHEAKRCNTEAVSDSKDGFDVLDAFTSQPADRYLLHLFAVRSPSASSGSKQPVGGDYGETSGLPARKRQRKSQLLLSSCINFDRLCSALNGNRSTKLLSATIRTAVNARANSAAETSDHDFVVSILNRNEHLAHFVTYFAALGFPPLASLVSPQTRKDIAIQFAGHVLSKFSQE
jgi:hypothetical protein